MTNIRECISRIEKLIPLKFADTSWDNVGFLVETSSSNKGDHVSSIFIVNDLTNKNLDEIVQKKNKEELSLCISYHPPIFKGMKSLNFKNPREKAVVRCLENNIAVYSPHTAVDSMKDGLNDFLAKGIGEDGKVTPIVKHKEPKSSNEMYKVMVFAPKDNIDLLRQKLSEEAHCGTIGNYIRCSFETPGTGRYFAKENTNPKLGEKNKDNSVEEMRLEMVVGKASIGDVCTVIKKYHPYEEPAFEIYKLEDLPLQDIGEGRKVNFESSKQPTISQLIDRAKKLLGTSHLRVALGEGRTLESKVRCVSVCAGSGSTVVPKANADVYFTGEMQYHSVLEAVEKGVTVILSEHTLTERAFLKTVLLERIKEAFKDTQVKVDAVASDEEIIKTL